MKNQMYLLVTLIALISFTTIDLAAQNDRGSATKAKVRARTTTTTTSGQSTVSPNGNSQTTQPKSSSSTQSNSSNKTTTTTTNNQSSNKTNNRNNNRTGNGGTSTHTNTNTNPPRTNTPIGGMTGQNGVYIGGGVNSGTDGKNFFVEANPYLGYRFNQRTDMGVGPIYQYRQSGGNPWNMYGMRAFVRYNLTYGVHLTAEYEWLNFPGATLDDPRRSTSRLPIGATINRNFAGMNFNGGVTYDLLHNKDTSPYSTPFTIRGGVNFGAGTLANVFGRN